MKLSNKKLTWKQSALAAAVSSVLLLAGCAGEDGSQGANGLPGVQGPVGPTGPAGAGGSGEDATASAAFAYTTSDFAIYEDAILVSDYFAGELEDGADITDAINLAIFDLKDGETLVLPQGRFFVSDTILVQNKRNITFTGYGINETQLDFSTSTVSDDAVRFEGGSDLEIRDFSVFEANKNGIKIEKANGVKIAYTGAIWEGELDSGNGAYGLYPVSSQNVLMEYNYAYGSADAGIYVGQTSNIVVRHNIAKNNVAGIEIENSTNADVYKNLATGNTGGILVFDLPGLEKAYGGNVRVFDNDMIANNTNSVAPKTSTVGLVPPGTGFLNLATSSVEVYHNYFKDNETAAMEIVSYFIVNTNLEDYAGRYVETMMSGWSPNFKLNYIHDNVIERTGAEPRGHILDDDFAPGFSITKGFTGMTDAYMAALYPIERTGYKMPAILFDGIGEYVVNETEEFKQLEALNADFKPYPVEDGLCLDNNIDGNSSASHQEFYGEGAVAGRTAEIAASDNGPQIGMVFPSRAAQAVFGTQDGLPVPTFEISNIHSNTKFACTQPRLAPATVSFRGKSYGCDGDDRASYSCNL
ncbi:parallel beta-helix domain-containing protein [Thalassomonas sp. M1454]|uniref:parallel beta-helix domain-containing protein n=1 Tax=Thalassomonas sp. M1454 TaxID=2594477 RepID=UPI00117F9A6E|nr:parallel beta-helix domain-containing protein [Thalassomonas sp. M1454]TRX54008.1 hypothetical protein FNN08_13745 [Thalassomonas sp. M1454]